MTTRIGLVFGGRSVEHKVSVVSARTVAESLAEAGYKVVPLGIAQDGCWVATAVGQAVLDGESDAIAPVGKSVAASLRHLLNAQVSAIFPMVHGTWGEDGTLQGLCEMLDLPYAGTDITSSAVCMDKILCKQVLEASGLRVVDYRVVERRLLECRDASLNDRLSALGFPVFVKPAIGGSSVGVRKVESSGDMLPAVSHALDFADRVLIEKAIVGRELECAVLGYGEIEASGIGEIVPGADFYDYADKYLDDNAGLIHQADLEPAKAAELRQLAIDAFAAVGGSGMARVDFLVDDDGIYVNEINTLPGFTAISMYPKLWQIAGVEAPDLVDRLVKIGLRRHADRRQLDRGIKSWISSLDG